MSYYGAGQGYGQQPQQPMSQQGYLQSQPTGYNMGGQQQQPMLLQGQRTGYPQPQMQSSQQAIPQYLQSTPTGFGIGGGGGGAGGGMRPLQGQPTGYLPNPQQQRPMMTGFPSSQSHSQQQPQLQPLLSQPTGFPGSGGSTFGGGMGSTFINTFMPAQGMQATPYMDPSQMQFAHPAASSTAAQLQQGHYAGGSFQNSFQQSQPQAQSNQSQGEVPIPWKLTPEEKKRYDQIFRAWDQQGSGFIGGAVAKEVFGQAGLERDDLMSIWNLADVEDRGKLNIDEFHVAMGLIYRRLNGNPIPTSLPPELAPPSARDLSDSVGFLKSLLKNDQHQRSTNIDEVGQGSYAKSRSLHDTTPDRNRKDATVYRHDDSETTTKAYKSSSRHLDRDSVRYRSGDSNDSPTSELDDVKRQFKNTQSLLDKSRERDDEEEELKEDLRALKRRIGRVNDDLEYNLRSGRRTGAKDDERRKLERELLRLEHEEFPALERKIKEKELQKNRDQKKFALERDQKNDRYYEGRFGDNSGSRGKYDEDGDETRYRSSDNYRNSSRERTGYNKGTYQDRDQEDRGTSRDRRVRRDEDRETSYRSDRISSPQPMTRSSPPPPPPPPTAAAKVAPVPPSVASPAAAAVPSASPVPDTKNMTPEERAAHRRAEAQKRVQERLRALGVAAPSSDNALDSTISDRLQQDKMEAARKASEADKELEAKELQRKSRLEQEKLRGVAIEQSINARDEKAVEQVRGEVRESGAKGPVASAAMSQLDQEEQAIATREAALEKEKAERLARVKQLEKELAEAKEAEDRFTNNKAKFSASGGGKSNVAKVAPPPPPSRSSRGPAAPPPSRARQAQEENDDFAPSSSKPPTAPAAPPAPPPPAASSALSPPATESSKSPSTNPFHRLTAGAVSPASSATTPLTSPNGVGKPNPFFKGAPVSSKSVPSASTAPPAPKAPAFKAPPPPDDDWDSPAGLEKDQEDDSSDDDLGDRNARQNLAQNLFRNIGLAAPSRPPSSQAATPPRGTASPTLAAPSAPPAPVPPPAPMAPRAPPALDASSDAPPRSALLGEIQGGLRLKKATTKDKSGPTVAGSVIGDAAPPVQLYVPPPSPPPAPTHSLPSAAELEKSPVAATAYTNGHQNGVESDKSVETAKATHDSLPAIVAEDPLDAIDQTKKIRMWSLFAYEGQRDEDLTFAENLVIIGNPPKDASSPWWYGTIEKSGKSGWMPKDYVEAVQVQSASAIYAYTATSNEEHSVEEGEHLNIIDTSDESWWKAEKNGVIALVPASYCELGSRKQPTSPHVTTGQSEKTQIPSLVTSAGARATHTRPMDEVDDHDSDEDEDEDESDSDLESSDPHSSREREAERLRVLEAAGLLVRSTEFETETEAGEANAGARRPAPARPRRRAPPAPAGKEVTLNGENSINSPRLSEHDGIPDEAEREERMEDAYDVYQRVMREQPLVPSSVTNVSPILPVPSPPLVLPPSTSTSTPTQRESLSTTASSFLSRVVTGMQGLSVSGTSAEGKRPLNSSMISGPSSTLLSGAGDRRSGVHSTGIGSSWTSLIDPSALENMPDRERKRQESMFELIVTEQAYVQSLQLVNEVFYSALQPVLPDKAIQVIFANIDDIMIFEAVFLSELEEQQRISRLYIDTIGDVILTHTRSLDIYRGYCVNQTNAARTLSDLKSSDASLRALLESRRVKGLELEHFLLEPMQRLTRYPLLINQILRYTESDHPDTATLTSALQMAESVLNGVNEAVRSYENSEKLAYLSDTLSLAGVNARLNLTAPTRLMGARSILKEGQVTKARSGRKLNIHLFNDLLLLTEKTADGREVVYRYPIPLEECSVRSSRRDDSSFTITHRSDSINVKAPTVRQCSSWVKEIERAQVACQSVIQKRLADRNSVRF